MIRRWAGLVSGCCLLIVMDGLNANCYAAPRQEQVGSASSETIDTRRTSTEEPVLQEQQPGRKQIREITTTRSVRIC